MNRDLAILLAVLAFAIATALLYIGSLGVEGSAVPAPTPSATPAPTPRPEPLAARPRATPPPAPTPPPPAPEPVTAVSTTIRGRVVLEDGAAPGVCDVFLTVDGERMKRWTADDGTFAIEAPGGAVSIYGGRAFGALHTRSDTVTLDTREGGTWEVTLVIPESRTGGLGIGSKAHPEGIRVTRAIADTPAAELGLKRNDVILEVDGVPTKGWSTTKFIREMTGPVGTLQNFRVRRQDGREETLEFERRVIPGKKRKSSGAASKP